MYATRKKYEVADPALYGDVIRQRKKRLRYEAANPEAWLELGLLHERRLSMLRDHAEKSWIIKHYHWVVFLCLSLAIGVYAGFMEKVLMQPWGIWVVAINGVIVLTLMGITLTMRYPISGKRYFKKALRLDPSCGAAWHHLGVIALRRGRRRKAFHLLERAASLKNECGTERLLGEIYQEEFARFTEGRSVEDESARKREERFQEEVKALRSENMALQNRIERLTNRLHQEKRNSGTKEKRLNVEMTAYIEKVRDDYEEQIRQLQLEAEEEARELEAKERIRLTTEIMESNEKARRQDTDDERVVQMLGTELWRALSQESQLFLSTAERVYHSLCAEGVESDYSLVGMEVCKALEYEVNRKLVDPFVTALNGDRSNFLALNRTGGSQGRPVYYTYLAKVVDRVHYPEVNALTLGQFLFVLKRAISGDVLLEAYNRYLSSAKGPCGYAVDHAFCAALDQVVTRYRNSIAHQSPMNREAYENLVCLVLTGERALIKTCALVGSEREDYHG